MDSEPIYKIVDGKKVYIEDPPNPIGRITDEKLPHRFGNRKTRRRMQAEIRKIK